MTPRVKQLVLSLKKHRLGAFLVTKDANISYLTDFPASESWLFVSPRGTFYITDFRYVLEAQKGLKGIKVVRYEKSFGDTVRLLAKQTGAGRIGFDDRYLSVASFKRLQKTLKGGPQLVCANHLVENLREIKDTHEISMVRKALKLNLEAYDFLKGVIKPGISEAKVLEKLEGFVKTHGAGFSFPPIIASGPNSCFPHAKVTARKIRNNEIVLVDMGMDIKGYKSDLTRIYFLGKIPHSILEVNDFVYAAQEKAIEKIRAGVPAALIDQQARNYLAKKGLDKYFGHSLGHGVGIEIHEAPSISERSPAVLKEGMIFTVEPAVYIPHKFGIRIEDMVLVTKNGCEVLSRRVQSKGIFK